MDMFLEVESEDIGVTTNESHNQIMSQIFKLLDNIHEIISA